VSRADWLLIVVAAAMDGMQAGRKRCSVCGLSGAVAQGTARVYRMVNVLLGAR